MAIYHLHMKNISRGDGRSAVAAAAYRAGESIPNEAEERLSKFGGRRDVRLAAIALPEGAAKWLADRSRLWNEAERCEKRKDARLAKEIEVALPRELTPAAQLSLVLALVKALTDAGLIVDYAIHDDPAKGNPHAHLMIPTRLASPTGFGAKARNSDSRKFLLTVRVLWSKLANEALGKAGAAVNIDHRSYAARGMETEPGQHRGVDRQERAMKRQNREQAHMNIDKETDHIRAGMVKDLRALRQFPSLAQRTDWPPATRSPARDMNAQERHEHRLYWREVDRRHYTQIERDEPQAPDMAQDKGNRIVVADRPDAPRIREQIARQVERETMGDFSNDALRQFSELQESVRQAFLEKGIDVGPGTPVEHLNKQLADFRRTLLEIRLREAQVFEREQEEERALPVPGPDRMPVSQAELHEAQEHMLDEVERDAPTDAILREISRTNQQADRHVREPATRDNALGDLLRAIDEPRGGPRQEHDEPEREHER